MSANPRPTRLFQPTPPAVYYTAGLAALALTLGLAVAVLPPLVSGALAVGLPLLLISLAYPVVALGLALLIGPTRALLVAVVPGLPLDPGQLGLLFFLGLWLVQRLSQRKLQLPMPALAWPFGLFILVGLASLWAAPNPVDGLQEVIKWAQMLLVALLTLDLAQRGHRVAILTAVLLAGAVQAAGGIYQWGLRGIGPEHFAIAPGRYRAYGAFEQPNPFGGYMGLVWPLAAGLAFGGLLKTLAPLRHTGLATLRNWPLTHWLALTLTTLTAALCGVALLVSYSRGAWLGAAAAGAVLLIFAPRQRGLGLALGLVAALGGLALWQAGLLPASITSRLSTITDFIQVYDVRGVHINDANFSLIERIAHWQAAFAMTDAHPWLGVGLGNYTAAYPDFRLINWVYPLGHAHNIYFNLLAEVGLIGLVAYLSLWGFIVWQTLTALIHTTGWQRGLALGLLGVWAHLSTHHLVDYLYVNNLHIHLGVLLGLLAALPHTPRSSEFHHATTPTPTAYHSPR